jgi:putative phosphoesterase
MRIAVVSDTHDRYPPDLPGRLRSADEIWHLGDVCKPEVLAEFEALGPPLIVVRGNNDFDPRWPLERTLPRAGLVFHLIHIPPRSAPKGAQVLLHGHTHVPRDEVDAQGVRWLNPGCISFPRAGIKSFAWLTLAPGRIRSWEYVTL